jgi:hypothetical protein
MANKRLEEQPELGALGPYYMDELSRAPKETFLTVERALGGLPELNFGEERAMFIGILSRLPGMEAEAGNLTRELLSRPRPAALETSAAHAVLIRSVSNADIAWEETRNVIARQTDPVVQQIFVEQFVDRYPEREEQARREFPSDTP